MRERQDLRLMFAACLLVCAVLAAPLTAQRNDRASRVTADPVSTDAYVPNELLVKINGGAQSKAAVDANRVVGATIIEELGLPDWQRVRLPDGLTVDTAITVYKGLAGVEYAQPNFYYHLLATPNDPQYLANISTSMYGLGKISAPAAWDLSTGSSSVVVADIDSGMLYTHQDLAPNAWINPGEIPGNGVDDDGNGYVDDVHGWDFFYNVADPTPGSASGHGTHTAGTIGAAGNNGLNVVGVNWNVKILPLKIYSPAGTDSTSSMLVNAYAYVRMMKTRAVNPVNIVATNNSYGDCGEACGYDQATKDGIDAMGDAGIVNVFAAGNTAGNNNDTNPAHSYPSVYTSPSIISVAASDANDLKASFSCFGPISVDLAAPGTNILSTWNSSNTSTTTLQGTSMATPHVTGAVALLSAYRPSLSMASLKASILNNVDVLPAWSGLVKTGGRLNVFKAMQNPTVCTFATGGATEIRLRGRRAQDLTLNVTAATNCDYMVKTNATWLKITGNNVFSGNGAIAYHVDSNPSGSPRTATLTFGGRTFIIRQMQAGRRG